MTRRAPSLNAVFAGAVGLGALRWPDAAFVDPWHGETARRGAPAAIVAVLFATVATLL
jgi:hypothetical protein